MYIGRVPARNNTTGESYFTHRLARTERVANMVRQITLLDLGRHFAVAQEDWPSLCPAQSLSRRCPCHAPVPPARHRTPPPASCPRARGSAGWPGAQGDHGPDARLLPGDAAVPGLGLGIRRTSHMSSTRLMWRGSRRRGVCPSYARLARRLGSIAPTMGTIIRSRHSRQPRRSCPQRGSR